MVRRLPDSEALVLDALRFYIPAGATFHVAPPTDWNTSMPYGVVVRVGGKTDDPRFVSQGLFSVQAIASARDAASDLARDMMAALQQAALDSFGNAEGFISGLHITKEPVPVRDGLIGKHPDSFMFDATYTLWFGVRT